MVDTPREEIPRDPVPDSTLALLARGYRFISERCRRHGSDAFETRLMLRPVICTVGADAARMFYHPDRFTRVGAVPETTLRLLQDRGSVQSLDGAAHRARKQMFMAMMTPAARQDLAEIARAEWDRRIALWRDRDRVVLLPEVEAILTRAVCRWAGLPLEEANADRRTRELSAMIDGAGTIGPRNWRAQWLRRRSERWLEGIVAEVRAGRVQAEDGSVLAAVAGHHDSDGSALNGEEAAVELLNVLRPTVAIGRFVVFAALALHEHPTYREWLRSGGEDRVTMFAHEVRRFYPFFPAIGGRVRTPFEWRDHWFEKGDWVLLDLYGTNHDPRIWSDPQAFRPERFGHWDGSAYGFVPQGGGRYEDGHRCPGEWITIDLLKQAVRILTEAISYDVPPQDLTVDLSRMPAEPRSGFVIANVRPHAEP